MCNNCEQHDRFIPIRKADPVYGKGPVEQMIDKGLLKIEQENATLRQQIVKMMNCQNCEWEINCRNRKRPDCNEGEYVNWQMKGAVSGE